LLFSLLLFSCRIQLLCQPFLELSLLLFQLLLNLLRVQQQLMRLFIMQQQRLCQYDVLLLKQKILMMIVLSLYVL
jgi:hypothetical protein